MTTITARNIVIEALNAASIPELSSNKGIIEFSSGVGDIKISSLELDSLAKMEFCIYIEIHYGVSIVPDRLDEFETLSRLASHIQDILDD